MNYAAFAELIGLGGIRVERPEDPRGRVGGARSKVVSVAMMARMVRCLALLRGGMAIREVYGAAGAAGAAGATGEWRGTHRWVSWDRSKLSGTDQHCLKLAKFHSELLARRVLDAEHDHHGIR